jgi:uncharacterized membrane protein YccC
MEVNRRLGGTPRWICVDSCGRARRGVRIDRAYWMVAASALVLHQGLDWTRTFQRSVDRVIGTLLGLGFAGSVLSLRLNGIYLVAILTVLQFVIEVVVVRSYAMAVVFITATALIIASGGYVVSDLGHLLWVRGLDPASGCLIGLGVHALTAPRSVAVPVHHQLLRTVAAMEGVLAVLVNGEVTSPSARRTRRDLQHHTIALLRAFELGAGAAPKDREYAERSWPRSWPRKGSRIGYWEHVGLLKKRGKRKQLKRLQHFFQTAASMRQSSCLPT